tara:strand:- start:412 stop:699 length:288 start_codon:yes stop_codon:yes gene_type:complete
MPNKKRKRTAQQQANIDADHKKRQKRREKKLRKGTHSSQEDPMDRLMRRIAKKEKRIKEKEQTEKEIRNRQASAAEALGHPLSGPIDRGKMFYSH